MVMPEPSQIYRNVRSMEPLLPKVQGAAMSELSVRIIQKIGELKKSIPSPVTRSEVARLVREMNSYYSNLIEGHKTLPKDIEKALREDYSERDEDRRNQMLSVAHVKAEAAMRQWLEEVPDTDVYGQEFICRLHQEFYSHIPKEEWFTTSREGERHEIEPGKLRDHNVEVGAHIPPAHETLPGFLKKFSSFYSSDGITATHRLTAIAAAHHRLTWIHPFADGNGRVARLQSQAAIIRAGLDCDGLWTLSRGLAREKACYYRALHEADQPRMSDYDGRGNLSDGMLAGFCEFFLTQIHDQVAFMVDLVSPLNLIKRIEKYLRFERTELGEKTAGYYGRLLKELCIQGEIPRGHVGGILGVSDSTARKVIGSALEDELIATRSEKGPIRIYFPEKVVESYFPRLFTDLPVGG